MSFVNRLNVAFQDLGEVTVKEMKAFILLKQSALTPYDKRRVIVMTAGKISAEKIEMAMRSPNTKVLGSGSTMDPKKKVYPVNYVEDEVEEAHNVIEDDAVDEEWILQSLVERCPGSLCFSAYLEARSRTQDRIKARSFWPRKGKGKGLKKGFGSKGGGKRRHSLAGRIAASNCRVCGQKGHWKWECPKRSSSPRRLPPQTSMWLSRWKVGTLKMRSLTTCQTLRRWSLYMIFFRDTRTEGLGSNKSILLLSLWKSKRWFPLLMKNSFSWRNLVGIFESWMILPNLWMLPVWNNSCQGWWVVFLPGLRVLDLELELFWVLRYGVQV